MARTEQLFCLTEYPLVFWATQKIACKRNQLRSESLYFEPLKEKDMDKNYNDYDDHQQQKGYFSLVFPNMHFSQ